MFVVLWEFDVKRDSEVRFTFAYGSSGEWARLFRTAAGFRETRLLRSISQPLRYMTMDVWESREDCEEFMKIACRGLPDARRGVRRVDRE